MRGAAAGGGGSPRRAVSAAREEAGKGRDGKGREEAREGAGRAALPSQGEPCSPGGEREREALEAPRGLFPDLPSGFAQPRRAAGSASAGRRRHPAPPAARGAERGLRRRLSLARRGSGTLRWAGGSGGRTAAVAADAGLAAKGRGGGTMAASSNSSLSGSSVSSGKFLRRAPHFSPPLHFSRQLPVCRAPRRPARPQRPRPRQHPPPWSPSPPRAIHPGGGGDAPARCRGGGSRDGGRRGGAPLASPPCLCVGRGRGETRSRLPRRVGEWRGHPSRTGKGRARGALWWMSGRYRELPLRVLGGRGCSETTSPA